MRQYAPDPLELFELVVQAQYRPGWYFWIGDEERDPASSHGEAAGGLTLEIVTSTTDTHDHSNTQYCVRHIFPVPAASYNRESWMNWLFERCLDVEEHEAAEFFAIGREAVELSGPLPYVSDYSRGPRPPSSERNVDFPFQPVHAPHWDPYMRTVVHTTELARSTRFNGTVAPSPERKVEDSNLTP